jgi:hypothetical protein
MTLRLMRRNYFLNFGWLAVRGLNPDWPGRKFNFSSIRRFGEASGPEGGMRAVPRLCIILCLDICLTSEEKSRKTLIQGTQKVLGFSTPGTIRLVDLSPSSDGLDRPASPYRPWLTRRAEVPTLGQRNYLPSCRNRGFPMSGNLESKLTVGAPTWSANNGSSRSS